MIPIPDPPRKISNNYGDLTEFRKKIRTTPLLERVHKELKRRSRKIGAFPNDASLLGLIGSIFIDINEGWITGNSYATLTLEKWRSQVSH
jgi:transposase-like protein